MRVDAFYQSERSDFLILFLFFAIDRGREKMKEEEGGGMQE